MTELDRRAGRIEELVQSLERSPESVRNAARTLAAAVLAFHALGLSRLVDLVHEHPGLLGACIADDAVASLLLLHGLHPESMDSRVRRALESLPPEVAKDGSAELDSIAQGRARVRLMATGAAAAASLQKAAADALCRAAPDLAAVEFVIWNGRGGVGLPVVAAEGAR